MYVPVFALQYCYCSITGSRKNHKIYLFTVHFRTLQKIRSNLPDAIQKKNENVVRGLWNMAAILSQKDILNHMFSIKNKTLAKRNLVLI